ncbi:DMT family transporter [Brevirhabdus sp.]|uniref:DMT family transporter n=1 Tax=Brevirhabdus sp. TaxID=2004514 RepID=UPI00405A220F
MSDWIITLEGTEAGHRTALLLALSAALLHAVFGALQKGRFDPWLTRGAVDFWYLLMALPVALFVVPRPEPQLWLIFAGVWLIHTAYKVLQAMAYTRGAYTVVYPVVRGTGPLFAVIGAYLIFGEVFAPLQWLGVATLMTGILGLAAYNLVHVRVNRDTLNAALALAVITGMLVAIYTIYDAYGIRSTPDPFTFLAWFFVIDGLSFPIPAYLRWRAMPQRPEARGLLLRGFIGAIVAFGSFGSVMLATRLDKVGQAAVLRETSPVFAALIGWVFLKETVGPRRLGLMALIAAGAVIVETGG